jgi:hypothetical protein
MSIELVEHCNIRYAEILWSDTQVEHTTFFSPPESSFQLGLLAHKTGFIEPAHYHKRLTRTINDLQQMFVVQKGVVAVRLFTEEGEVFREVVLRSGDAIVLIHGTHAIHVIEDMQCISVKQGPFMGIENDKVLLEAER